MVSQKYRGSCIGAALAKWLAKNTVASQKMALEEKMEDGALEMLLVINRKGFLNLEIEGDSKIMINYYNKKINIPNYILLLMEDI